MWFCISSNNKKKHKRICIYTGKGRLKKLPKNIRNLFAEYDIQLITRVFPSTRKELFYLLLNSDAFISFDELTQINLEAASLGMPVFIANPLFPEKSLRRLCKRHRDTMEFYGEHNKLRMKGDCETSNYEEFSWSIGGRCASVRVGNDVYENKKGYCFKCLKPLRPDYTVFENYCLDC